MSNLTGQQIKDTYQSLVTLGTGNTITNGTGSVITDLAVTASNALVATSASYAPIDPAFSGSVASEISALEGSVTALNLETGSLEASISANSSSIASLTNATASYVTNAQTSSMSVANAVSASHAVNADSALTAGSATSATTAATASYAVTASYALNASVTVDTGSLMVTGSVVANVLTFTKGDGSSFDLTVATGSATSASYADYAVSSSHATYAETAGSSTTSVSASYAVNATSADSAIIAASAISASYANNASTADSATSASYAGNADLLDGLDSTEFAILANNNVFGGNQTFNDITVNGTGSFSYIQSVTGSAKIIGDAFIILNNDTPAERYAGIIVQDSGSGAPNTTASFFFDGVTNDWNYEYSNDGGATMDLGVAMFGPEYNTKGSPAYPTTNTLVKGNGHHLEDSSISDDGSKVTVTNPMTVTSVTASAAIRANGGVIT